MSRAFPQQDHRKRELGASRVRTLFWLLVLVAVLYVGYKTVPPYFANYQLQDMMRQEALFANYNRRTPEEVRAVIFREIQEQEIPAKREDIKVEMTSRSVRISVDYTVPIDLQVYQFTLHFNPVADNRKL